MKRDEQISRVYFSVGIKSNPGAGFSEQVADEVDTAPNTFDGLLLINANL